MTRSAWFLASAIAAIVLDPRLCEAQCLAESVTEFVSTPANLAPVPVRSGLIVISLFDPVQRIQSAVLLTPEGKEVGRFALGAAAHSDRPDGEAVSGLVQGRLSPDGTRLAALRVNPFRPDNRGPWVWMHLWVFDLESKYGPEEALRPKIKNPSLAWSPDGTKLVVSEVDPEKGSDPLEPGKLVTMVSWFYDFRSKTKTMIELPEGHEIVDISADGKSLLTRTRPALQWDRETAHVLAIDTFRPRRIGPEPFQAMRFSPDGKKVIGYRPGKKEHIPVPGSILIASVQSGNDRTIDLPSGAPEARHVCWSPDGQRIAFQWTKPSAIPDAPQGGVQPSERVIPKGLSVGSVTVADLDGARPRTIFQTKSGQLIYGVDWR